MDANDTWIALADISNENYVESYGTRAPRLQHFY